MPPAQPKRRGRTIVTLREIAIGQHNHNAVHLVDKRTCAPYDVCRARDFDGFRVQESNGIIKESEPTEWHRRKAGIAEHGVRRVRQCIEVNVLPRKVVGLV